MLLPSNIVIARTYAPSSLAVAAGSQSNVTVTSGAAHTKGSWTLISSGAGLVESIFDRINIQGVETSGGVITATTLNVMVDIGVGTSVSSVRVVLENLAAPQAQGMGALYFVPFVMPRGYNLYARMQCTAASAVCGINVCEMEGRRDPTAYGVIKKVDSIGAVLASTTGVAITPSSSSTGAWTQIVASTARRYVGVMASPVFNVDTSLTSGLHQVVEVGIGGAGVERRLGSLSARSFLWSTGEQKEILCKPYFVGVPAGTRLSARVNGSTTPDNTNSVILYGIIGG